MRHHRSALWIVCLTAYRGWRHPLEEPGRWTPIFFLDDAVALAAGHRPCGLCRRDDHHRYRDAVGAAEGASRPILATELDRRLVAERHRRGRGIDRAADRLLWEAPIDDLPDGTVVVHRGEPALVVEDRLHRFDFDGWGPPDVRPRRTRATVLTPPISVTALAHGFRPTLHPSVRP